MFTTSPGRIREYQVLANRSPARLTQKQIQGGKRKEQRKLKNDYPVQFPVENLTGDMFVVGLLWHLINFREGGGLIRRLVHTLTVLYPTRETSGSLLAVAASKMTDLLKGRSVSYV